MRVLFLTPAYPPAPGGGERYVRALAQHLTVLGCEISVIASSARGDSDFWQGRLETYHEVDGAMAVERLAVRGFGLGRYELLAWRKAMAVLSSLKIVNVSPLLQTLARHFPRIVGLEAALDRQPCPDLVHGFNASWEYPMVAGWKAARWWGVPFVATPFAHFGANPRGRMARNTFMQHHRQMLADADAVLTLTDVEQKGMAAWGVTPKISQAIGGGIDPVPDFVSAAEIRKKFQLPERFGLFVGRLNRDKGAIDTAKAAIDGGIPIAFAGSLMPDFAQFHANNPHPNILLLNFVSESDKHALLNACAFLTLPSHSESFGIVILEAWAHGKGVVAADAGGIPALVTHGRDGLLVRYGDVGGLSAAMQRIFTDQSLATRLGKNGQQTLAERFNWSRVAQDVLAVYQVVSNAH